MFNLSSAAVPILLAASWVLATVAVRGRARAAGLSFSMVGDLSFWTAIGALLGARLVFVALHWPLFAAYPQDIVLTLWRGLSFYGGLGGGLAAGLYFARQQRLSFWALSDTVAPALPLGIALARLGTFVYEAGQVGWLRGGDLPMSLVANLTEAALCLGLFVTVSYRRKGGMASPFLMAIIGYGLLRAMLDLFREDGGAPLLALGIVIAGFGTLIIRSRMGKEAARGTRG